MHPCCSSALALGLLLLCGCGSSATLSIKISGTVTLDGVPIPDGMIMFVPTEEGSDARAAVRIIQGHYSLETPPGPKRVEIIANRQVPGKTDQLQMPLIEQYVPEHYNKQTTLSAEVKSGKTSFDFALSSKD